MSDIEKSHFSKWRKEIKKKTGKSRDEFFSYFDDSLNYNHNLKQGMWDFSYHILKDEILDYLGNPHNCNALEIGFGGGRLLRAASYYFNNVIGIDIHKSFTTVKEMLKREKINNVKLIKGSGNNIPLEDKSIDFIYSFIVMQHLPTLNVLIDYIREIKRVLKPQKPACLYVGNLKFNWRMKNYVELVSDQKYRSRDNTLLLRSKFFCKILRHEGFKILKIGINRKKPWIKRDGNQNYAVIIS